MIRLYAAIGHYLLNSSNSPVVVLNNQEYALSVHELVLWSGLAFQILTYEELKEEFYRKEQELHILGESDFDYYLNRLITRKLIASGKDCTGLDALYDLLGHLYLKPAISNSLAKIIAFIKLYFVRGIAFRKSLLVFHKENINAEEKTVLNLLKNQILSTAEIIQCNEHGKKYIRSNTDLMESIYDDEVTDCDNISIKSRFAEKQRSTLVTVSNLYLKQMIIFEIL